jgi:hypothetical protein
MRSSKRATSAAVPAASRPAFRQQPDQRGKVHHRQERLRRREHRRGPKAKRLDGIMTEMLVEPGAPDNADAVAGLQDRPQARPGTAADETQMAAMLTRQEFGDGA